MGKRYEIFRNFSFLLVVYIFLYITSRFNFLLAHTIAESFCIIIAFTIFIIFWNAQKNVTNLFLLYFGIAALFIGILDYLHTASYPGIYIFENNYNFELWIAARYLESLALLSSLLLRKRNISISKTFVFLTYAVITLLFILSIFYWRNFPDSYSHGSGLSIFHLHSEYLIGLIYIISIIYLYKNKDLFSANIYMLLQAAFVCKIFSGILLTLNFDIYGLLNITGHYFKLISYYFIYKAVVVKALKEPYESLFRELKENEKKLIEQIKISQIYANVDGLTNLYNRRYINEQIEQEIKRCQRYAAVFSIILFDIDRFKSVNDRFGHLIGDEILKEVAQIIKKNTRSTDIVGRYGGEEFLVILPETKIDAAYKVAEKIRNETQSTHFTKDISLTISGGVAQYTGETANSSNLLAIADKNLYKAKADGRNLNIM